MSGRGTLKVAFVPQNETHAQSFSLMAETLRERGHEAEVVCLDEVTGMRTRACFPPEIVRDLPLTSDVPFYRLSRWRQLEFMWRHARTIRSCAPDCDLLVIGNDGAIQRVLLRAAKERGARTVLLLDGLVVAPGSRLAELGLSMRRRIFHISTLVRLEHLAPGNLGHGLLDLVLVMDRSLEQIMKQGLEVETDIEVVLLPRHERLVQEVSELRAARHDGDARVLYATSAYRWHRLHDFHRFQVMEIERTLELARERSDARFRIRIHPREEEEHYRVGLPSNVELSTARVPLAADLAWSTVVWTSRSSLAFEAGLCAIPTYISTAHFPPPHAEDFLLGLANVRLVKDFAEALDDEPPTLGPTHTSTRAAALDRCLELLDSR